MKFTRGLAFAIALVGIPLLAQEPGDKSQGEEQQIKERVRWFREAHGLEDVNRPDLLRRRGVQQSRQLQSQESLLGASATWMELGPSPMTMLNWAMGRVAGRISAIAVHPNDIDTVYVGAAGGGLWKTTNNGTTWTCLSDNLGTQSFGSIFIDPSNPETVWAGSGDHAEGCVSYFGMGLFKTTDGGATMVPMNGTGNNSLDLSFIAGIVYHPSNDQNILVAGHGFCSDGSFQSGGIYRSTDGGQNWTKVLSGEGQDLVSDPSDPSVFYASLGNSSDTNNGVYRSLDGGATWGRLENGIQFGSSIQKLRLTMSPGNPDILYAFNGGGGGRIFRTENGGDSWTQEGTGACEGQCFYNLCIDVSPNDPDRLIVGSIRHAVSNNRGQSLSYVTSGWGSGQTVHQDTHVLVFDRTDNNRYWVGTDGGIWRTDNGGASFTNLNGNLNITQFYDITVDPSDKNRVFGGAQDNSSLGTDNNTVWDVNIVSGDGFMNLVDPLNSNIVFQTSYPNGTANMARSTTGGTPNSFNWLPMTGLVSGEPYPWVTPLAIEANTAGDTTYLFLGSNRVYISSDSASTWSPLSTSGLSSSSISVIEPLAVGDAIMVYAGTSGGGIFRCDNVLASFPTWNEVTGNYPGSRVSDIAIDANDPMRVYVTRGAFGANKLYMSTSGGTNWTAVGANLPDLPTNTVAIDPIDSNRIFVGNDIGVYASSDGGNTFATMMDGFPMGVPVSDLEITSDPPIMTAGTYGRGAWQIPVNLANLEVEAGFDQAVCLGDPATLGASSNNGVKPLSWMWTVVEGPDTSPAQFSDPTEPNPTFTPSLEGEYLLEVTVGDDASRNASDTLGVRAGTEESFGETQRIKWGKAESDAGYETRYDLNHSGAIEILDILLQMTSPVCN